MPEDLTSWTAFPAGAKSLFFFVVCGKDHTRLPDYPVILILRDSVGWFGHGRTSLLAGGTCATTGIIAGYRAGCAVMQRNPLLATEYRLTCSRVSWIINYKKKNEERSVRSLRSLTGEESPDFTGQDVPA